MNRPVLTTPRIRLEPMTSEHLPLLVELDTDAEVLRYILGRARSAQEAQDYWAPICADGEADAAGLGWWVGRNASDAAFLGWWDLSPARPVPTSPLCAEAGWRLARRHWRQGYATEGARALLKHGFSTVGLNEVWAETMAVNEPSRRVMTRLGMRHLRTEHRSWDEPLPGADQGEVVYHITRENWLAMTPPPPIKSMPFDSVRGRVHPCAVEEGTRVEPSEQISDTERAVHGAVTSSELRAFLDRWVQSRLGSPISDVRFRAGRIDAVWGVELQDGRDVVIKAHRTPVDLGAAQATMDAQRALAAAGFPCPVPLAGFDEVDGRVLTAETLIVGARPNGRQPTNRRLLADGLARHIEILRAHPALVGRAGKGPSWCRYQDGPWPVPHDTLVDLGVTVAGYEWLDVFGRRAADQILDNREPDPVVVGHADWYAGNTAVADGRLVGVFDWQLVADTEAVIAGFTASCYAASASGGGGLSSPTEVAVFLQDYEEVRRQRLSDGGRRAAAAAAAWILAFNARWQVGLIVHDMCDYSVIDLVRDHQEDYLSLTWF